VDEARCQGDDSWQIEHMPPFWEIYQAVTRDYLLFHFPVL